MRVVRRLAIRLVELLGAIVAAAVVLLAFAGWRLTSGPLSLDFLTPYIEQALVEPDSGLAVRIDHTLLSLNREEVTIGLVARGVRLAGRNGEVRLTLPEIALDLSLRAAFNGIVAPTRLVLEEPSLRFVRALDGTVRFGVDIDVDQGDASQDFARQLLAELSSAPDPKSPFGELRSVAMRQATVTFVDEGLGLTWQARRANVSLSRDRGGISGSLAMTVEAGGENAELNGRLRFSQADKRLQLNLGFADLEPARFASAAPALAPLSALHVPVSGEIGVSIDLAALRIDAARADLKIGEGTIFHPGLIGGSQALTSGAITANYDVTLGRLVLERGTLEFAGVQAQVTGTLDGLRDVVPDLTGRLSVTGDVTILHVLANDLPHLWPLGVAHFARDWVTANIHDGIADQTKVAVALDLDLKDGVIGGTDLRAFDGTMSYHGVTVDYFKPLPPVRGVDGTASFDRQRFTLRPTVGTLKNVKVSAGLIDLTQLDTHDEQGAITVTVNGPLREALEVIDSKPLFYAHEFGIDPAKTVGTAVGQLSFKMPLIHDLKPADVVFKVGAKLSEVGIEKMLFGLDLTEGAFDLKLDNKGLAVEGQTRLAGFQAAVSWKRSFDDKDPAGTRYTLKGVMDDATRRNFDLDVLPDQVWGPIGVDLSYVTAGPKRATGNLALDLKDTNLQIPQLGWSKEPGTAGSAKMSLDFADDKLAALHDLTINAGGLGATVEMAFDPGHGPARIEIKRLAVGDTDASAMVDRRKEGGWRAEVRGKSLDVSALMSDVGKDDASSATDPLVIDARLDRLILGPKREVHDVSGQMFSDGTHWQAARFDGTLAGDGKINLRFGEASGDRSFRMASDDLGATLQLFDISENVEGGRLTVTGQAVDNGSKRQFSGRFEGADYKVVRAPLFARLLSVASFSGIANLLGGGGIPFTTLNGDFSYESGILALKETRAYGGAIGINASGSVDLQKSTLDLSGTLVPAYMLNSILGNIPLLGKLLLGGEGQGIFGANFRVAGDMNEPKMSVNPLSALAPGVLRRLFLFGTGDPTAPPRPPAEDAGTKQ